MAKLKKPKPVPKGPLPKRPIGESKTTTDLKKKLKERQYLNQVQGN